ncbi:peptidase M23 [Pasteurellaceae bacterium RH1A]|nr:peptidase M23 [Pasteurellaceae bacterium RH1A]
MGKPPTAQSLPNPVQGRSFIDTWHAPRGGGRLHEGVDIFAKRGTPIQSTTRGVVMRIGESRLGGIFVTVLGEGLMWHYYAHLDSVAEDLHRFKIIPAGHIIGYVGDTGNAKGTPPHLHYGIYEWDRTAVNPFPLVDQKKGFE